MKKLKLLIINKRELNSPELNRIKGGFYTNYNCSCSPPHQESNMVDYYLDTYSEAGYLP
jgi:natural product precursor